MLYKQLPTEGVVEIVVTQTYYVFIKNECDIAMILFRPMMSSGNHERSALPISRHPEASSGRKIEPSHRGTNAPNPVTPSGKRSREIGRAHV